MAGRPPVFFRYFYFAFPLQLRSAQGGLHPIKIKGDKKNIKTSDKDTKKRASQFYTVAHMYEQIKKLKSQNATLKKVLMERSSAVGMMEQGDLITSRKFSPPFLNRKKSEGTDVVRSTAMGVVFTQTSAPSTADATLPFYPL